MTREAVRAKSRLRPLKGEVSKEEGGREGG